MSTRHRVIAHRSSSPLSSSPSHHSHTRIFSTCCACTALLALYCLRYLFALQSGRSCASSRLQTCCGYRPKKRLWAPWKWKEEGQLQGRQAVVMVRVRVRVPEWRRSEKDAVSELKIGVRVMGWMRWFTNWVSVRVLNCWCLTTCCATEWHGEIRKISQPCICKGGLKGPLPLHPLTDQFSLIWTVIIMIIVKQGQQGA